MRISDWSSDVCSSDLCLRQFADGLLARIDKVGIDVIGVREWTNTQHSIFRLKGHFDAFGNVIGDQCGNANAQIDVKAVLKFPCRTRRHLVAGPTFRCFGHYAARSEEHPSELQSLMRISYAVFCLKKTKSNTRIRIINTTK